MTLDTEVMGNNDEFGTYKVVKIPVYQKTEISKLIKPLQPHMLKATFCSEGKIHFPKEELKKKQTYLFSQTWIMTTRLESMFSFYNPHNMNCRTLGFCLLVYLLEGEKKEQNYVFVRLKHFFSEKNINVVIIYVQAVNSCLNFRDSESWWLPPKAMGHL